MENDYYDYINILAFLGLYKYDKCGNKVADYIPSGINTRYAYEKGMLFTFDILKFAEEVAGTYILEDVWGTMRDIRDYDIHVNVIGGGKII